MFLCWFYTSYMQPFSCFLIGSFFSWHGIKQGIEMVIDQVYLICQATRLSLRHKDMDTTRKEINAMEDLREKVDLVFSDENLAFPYSIFYLGWETNKVRVKIII